MGGWGEGVGTSGERGGVGEGRYRGAYIGVMVERGYILILILLTPPAAPLGGGGWVRRWRRGGEGGTVGKGL